ncbi:hypothetical protein F0243_12525 [Vibrio mediterranei]|nr:hypothetical protein [Vibrio mediterranei]
MLLYKSGFNILSFTMSKYIFGGGSKIAIFHTFGAAVAGSYALAWQLVTLISILFTQIVRVWRLEITNKARDRDLSGALKSCHHMMSFVFVISIMTGICVFIGLDYVLPYYNADFPDVRGLIIALLVYLPVIGFDYSVSVIAIAVNKTKLMRFVYFLIAIFTAVIYYLIFVAKKYDVVNMQPEYFIFSISLCHLMALSVIYYNISRGINSES